MSLITNNPGQLNFGAPGDTIAFSGTHVLSNSVWPGDRNYVGTAGARITGGNEWTVKFNNAANVKMSGLLFDNANLLLENCRNFYVNTPFRNMIGRGDEKSHAIRCVKLRDSTIVGDFKDMNQADTCIEGFDPTDCVFSDGKYYNVHEGIHFTFFNQNNIANCLFERNIINGIYRHGIELQEFARKVRVKRNHISGRKHNGIGLSIATGGHASYEGTEDIVVEENVVDNTGWAIPDPSQCMLIELMGRAKAINNILVGGGQGIAITFNPPNTDVSGNKFQNVREDLCIVADQPHESYIPPVGDNDKHYTGPIPNAADWTAGVVPVPPTPSNMKVTSATAYTSFVRVVCEGTSTGNTVLQWRGGDGVWKDYNAKITLPMTIDVAFDPVKFKSWWFWFRLLDAVAPSAETKANDQLGKAADPVVTPAPPIKFTYLRKVLIKQSDGSEVLQDVPFGDSGQPDYTKAKPSTA